jgi:uncharacterized membrane protein YhfC
MNILVITYALNGLLMIAMPIGLAIFLARRWKLGGRIWWIGLATFILSQVGHIPFNALAGKLLNTSGMIYWPLLAQQLFNAVFLGLSAGLWEEGMRFLVLRFWAKDARSWRKGVLFGAGHGGAEAIIFGALALLAYINMMILRGMDLATVVPADQLEIASQQVAAYWSAPWYLTLFGALERLLTIPVQIAMALLVLQTFTRKQWFWFPLAVLYHAVVDASAVFALNYLSPYWVEALVAGYTLLSIFIIFRLRRPEPVEEPLPAAPVAPPEFAPRPVDESTEALDKTRFQ